MSLSEGPHLSSQSRFEANDWYAMTVRHLTQLAARSGHWQVGPRARD